MSETEIIALRLTRKSRRWFFVSAVLIVIAGIYDLQQWQANGTDPGITMDVSLCAAFLCAFLLWRMSRRGMGELRIEDDGIVIDMTSVLGRVTWANLEKVALAKRMLQPYLGIALKDAKAFIDTRTGMAGQHSLDMTLIKYGNRAASLFPSKGWDIGYKLLGYTPLPQSGSDLDMMAWNRTNFGFDLCLPLLGVEAASDIPARIEKHRPAFVETMPAPDPANDVPPTTAKPASNAADYKTCPQCAEQVRAAAKICRFCHYSFETAAAAKG